MPSQARERSVLLLAAPLVVVALPATACHKSHAAAPVPLVTTQPPIPSWLVTVIPLRGSSDSGVMAVDIRDRRTPPEYTRLTIDGTDVTAYAHKSPGLLHDVSGEGPVILKPGQHKIEVDRDVLGVGGAPDKLEDLYIYSFTSL
jgi:hypothetical protein